MRGTHWWPQRLQVNCGSLIYSHNTLVTEQPLGISFTAVLRLNTWGLSGGWSPFYREWQVRLGWLDLSGFVSPVTIQPDSAVYSFRAVNKNFRAGFYRVVVLHAGHNLIGLMDSNSFNERNVEADLLT